MPLDPRLNPYRDDLAADKLRDQVTAERYVSGKPAQVVRGTADLRRRPAAAAPLDTQLLRGEVVTVYEERDGWAWVQNHSDDYVGYVAASNLDTAVTPTSHHVTALRSFVFSEPDLKTPPLDCLSMSASVAVAADSGPFSALVGGGYVYSAHLAPRDALLPDFVATAERFLGTPYLWGGKDSIGLDCSGLVQVALAMAGIACPRDAGQQAGVVGRAADWSAGSYAGLQRGDLIYFPGHVAISLGGSRVLHANAHDMMVAFEELAPVEARVRAESNGTGITAVRRLA